jgi:23S rRNA pseudouridine1911/1915/1917 synthase
MNVSHSLTADHYLVTHLVGPSQHGIRLDNFLKERYRKRSREQLKKAIDTGAVSVKRSQGPHLTVGKTKPSSQLIPGDEVLVLTERKPEPNVCFDYQILYEDQDLFVINKPANLPVHPAGRYFFNTLLIHLKTQGHRSPLRAEHEYYLVHRIDKETSGVLVLAKEKDACADITRQFAERTTEKRYLAIVKGICPEVFEMDLAMKRSTHSVIELKMMTAPESEGGQASFTGFKRLGVYGDYSLVECSPKTGRQHQIRVHLDAAGHPIVGDKLYGIPESEALRFYERKHLTPEAEARLILPRHALHAYWIRFTHPRTGKSMEFSAPLPQDLDSFLKRQKNESSLLRQSIMEPAALTSTASPA